MKNSIEGIMNQVLNLGKESLNESTAVDEAKSKKDGLPDTKKGFTYQDDDGNIYHSDVEIASYIDPETGKETRVFSYGKGAGLGAKTKKPLAVVSGMSNESAKLKRLMRENRKLRQGLKRSKLTESDTVTFEDEKYFPLKNVTADQVKKLAKDKDYKTFSVAGDSADTSTPGFAVTDPKDNDSIYPYSELFVSAAQPLEDPIYDSDNKEAIDDYEKALESGKASNLLDVADKYNINNVDLSDLESLVPYKVGDWFIQYTDESATQEKADQLAKELTSGTSNESVQLRRLMRENRRLRRGLRESADVVKIGSDSDESFYIYDVTPLVDRPVESGEEVAGYIKLYDGEDLKVLIKNSIEAYDLDLDDPVDKSINDDLEDVIKKAKSNDIYAVVTDQFREPDVDKIEKAIKRAI